MSEGAEEKLGPHHAWMPAFSLPHLGDPSTLILLAANLIPLLGVLFWGWDLFILMMLYWLETAIIGFWHILRMAILLRWLSILLVPFFVVHFGMFMGVHFVFLRAFFGKAWSGQIHGASDFIRVILVPTGLWIPALALFISHGFSFYMNFLRDYVQVQAAAPETPSAPGGSTFQSGSVRITTSGPEPAWVKGLKVALGDPAARKAGQLPNSPRLPNTSQDLMAAPYKRVMVMHFTIILGGMLSMILHDTRAAFFLLVALKTSVDLGAHIRKNFKTVPTNTTQPSTVQTP